MKFAEHLSAHITPEWASQYIRYDELKEILYSFVNEPQIIHDDLLIKELLEQVEEQFFQRCQQELLKINTFFAEKLAEAQRKFEELKGELDFEPISDSSNESIKLKKLRLASSSSKINTNDSNMQEVVVQSNEYNLRQRLLDKTRKRHMRKKQYKKIHELKLAFSEYYLLLILLQNYQTLNFTGFRKILKKHDKLLKTESGCEWRKENVENAPFYINKLVDNLITDTENLFIDKLEGGNRATAMKRLRVPPFEDKQKPSTTYKLGLFSGMLSILIPLVICLTCFLLRNGKLPFNWKTAIRLYRSSLFVIIHIVFVGINLYGWSSSGVNHVLIFEIDPRNHLSYQQLLEIGSFLGVLWIFNAIAFVVSAYFALEHNIYPVALVLFLVIYLINPFQMLHQNSRFWLLKVLWKIVSAPFHNVNFADFWLADQLTSFELIFIDIQYFLCWNLFESNWAPFTYFKENDECPCNPRNPRDLTNAFNLISILLSCYPSYIRFAQCLRRYRDTHNRFPHLANALKYSTTFFDTIALVLRNHFSKDYARDFDNPYFYLWIGVRVIGTLYKYYWDVKMDWGFFDKNAGENRFLREVCVYSHKWYYYFAIVQDFVLRFVWLIRLYDINWNAKTRGESYKDIVYTLIALVEVYRRFVWNFFRLENEHLNNCGQFRAVRDISIAPIRLDEHGAIIKTKNKQDINKNEHQQKDKDDSDRSHDSCQNTLTMILNNSLKGKKEILNENSMNQLDQEKLNNDTK